MDILVKYPTRGRPLWFFKTLDLHMRMLSGKHNVEFMVAMDVDDTLMNTDIVRDFLCQIEPPKDSPTKLTWYYREHQGKVAAVNSCIASREFDIVVVISDDIEPQQMAYDDTICACMLEAWPDLDGIIYFHDGRAKPGRVTIPIIGRPMYIKLGNIVHPDFIAWGDNYMSKLWYHTGRLKFYEQVLLRHCWAKYIHMDPTAKKAAKSRLTDARTARRLIAELGEELRRKTKS